MKRAYTDIPEGQMHYRFSGTGSNVIIFLHMSGSSSDEFELVGEKLAQSGFYVYAPDLLGFGSSDAPPRYYTLSDHANTVLSFMEQLGIQKAILYGNLATANMIVHLGVNHPEHIAGLILAHPLYAPDPVQYAQKRNLPEYSVVTPKEDGSHLLELWSRCFKYGENADICDARCRCLHSSGILGETLHWALFEDTPLIEMLPRLSVPTLTLSYGCFRNPEALVETAKAYIANGVVEAIPAPVGTPYIARSHPGLLSEIILRHWSSGVLL